MRQDLACSHGPHRATIDCPMDRNYFPNRHPPRFTLTHTNTADKNRRDSYKELRLPPTSLHFILPTTPSINSRSLLKDGIPTRSRIEYTSNGNGYIPSYPTTRPSSIRIHSSLSNINIRTILPNNHPTIKDNPRPTSPSLWKYRIKSYPKYPGHRIPLPNIEFDRSVDDMWCEIRRYHYDACHSSTFASWCTQMEGPWNIRIHSSD